MQNAKLTVTGIGITAMLVPYPQWGSFSQLNVPASDAEADEEIRTGVVPVGAAPVVL